MTDKTETVDIDKIRKTNSFLFKKELTRHRREVHVEGRVKLSERVTVFPGQIRMHGDTKLVVIRREQEGFVVAPVSGYRNPACSTELRTNGLVLQMWGTLHVPEDVLIVMPVIGKTNPDTARKMYEGLNSGAVPEDILSETGWGSIFEDDTLLSYAERTTSAIQSLIEEVI